MLTMIITLRNMERTPLVMAVGVTGNVIRIFLQGVLLVNGVGSARVD